MEKYTKEELLARANETKANLAVLKANKHLLTEADKEKIEDLKKIIAPKEALNG